MSANKPHVSIGMPVFNGEKYLKEALDSLLTQTYRDFELVISDNASTDRTQQICREYASKDSRIRYYRNERNIGCPKNFNRVFELSSGELFKWAAYDDVHAPEFLRKCVSVLDKDPSVVLCHSRTGRIDEYGHFLGNYDKRTRWRIDSWKPHERFGDLISISWPKGIMYGVGRAASYRKTSLLGSYIGADRNLMAEIGLIGRLIEIPEYLFFRRDHPEAYTVKFCIKRGVSVDNFVQQSAYWSKDDWTSYPNWRNCVEFFRSVNRVPLNWFERLLCYDQISKWFVKEGWMYMGADVENLLLRRSSLARKLISSIKFNASRTLISIIKKIMRTRYKYQ